MLLTIQTNTRVARRWVNRITNATVRTRIRRTQINGQLTVSSRVSWQACANVNSADRRANALILAWRVQACID